ncbi:MAG: thioesterase family protein [Acidimicrobiia bacterium]|nr:thioesterase family protein [Acidimicrobiia bacterium]
MLGNFPAVTSEFERDTAVTRQDGGVAAFTDGGFPAVRFEAPVRAGWEIGQASNGGYLLALAARAMSEMAERPPLTVTGHYLAPVPPGPASVDVETVRSGRRLATLRATLHRDGRPLVTLLGTFGRAPESDVARMDGAPPELEPYELSPPVAASGEPPFPTINDRLANRLRRGDDGFRFGSPTGRAEVAGWLAFADHGPIDELGLLLAADAFPPPVFNSGLPVAWVPTLELTVHVRAVPVPGPLRVLFRSRFISGGLLDEDGEMWDASDRLVALSRQISLIPRP